MKTPGQPALDVKRKSNNIFMIPHNLFKTLSSGKFKTLSNLVIIKAQDLVRDFKYV